MTPGGIKNTFDPVIPSKKPSNNVKFLTFSKPSICLAVSINQCVPLEEVGVHVLHVFFHSVAHKEGMCSLRSTDD